MPDPGAPIRARALRPLALGLLLVGIPAAAQEGTGAPAGPDPTKHVPSTESHARTAHPEAEHAARQIRCDCGCPPQSAWECSCGHAAGMVGDMDDLAKGGMSADDIIAGYLEREGPAILLTPPMKGWNLTAWFGPTVALLLAAGGVFGVLVVWRRRAAEGPEGAAPRASAEDPYRERALREMEALERGDAS